MSRRTPKKQIYTRLALSMRRGGFKIKHIAKAMGVSEFKIHCVLREHPDVRCPIDHRSLVSIEPAIEAKRRQLDWLPEGYRDQYRALLKAVRKSEAVPMILTQIARDARMGVSS